MSTNRRSHFRQTAQSVGCVPATELADRLMIIVLMPRMVNVCDHLLNRIVKTHLYGATLETSSHDKN